MILFLEVGDTMALATILNRKSKRHYTHRRPNPTDDISKPEVIRDKLAKAGRGRRRAAPVQPNRTNAWHV